MRRTLPFVSILCLLIAGCDRHQHADQPTANRSIVLDPKGTVAEIEVNVRISAADKRIADLEREVATLKAAPQSTDLELLTARVGTLEAELAVDRVISKDVSPSPSSIENAAKSRVALPGRVGVIGTSRDRPAEVARPATPQEAAAFARGPK